MWYFSPETALELSPGMLRYLLWTNPSITSQLQWLMILFLYRLWKQHGLYPICSPLHEEFTEGTHHPLTASFSLSHIGYSHVSYVEMNHKLEIDIGRKMSAFILLDSFFNKVLLWKIIPSQQMSLTYGKVSVLFGNL